MILRKRLFYSSYFPNIHPRSGKKYPNNSEKKVFEENKWKLEIDGSISMILVSIKVNGSPNNLNSFMILTICMELSGVKCKTSLGGKLTTMKGLKT